MLLLQTLWLPLMLVGVVLIVVSSILGAGRNEVEKQDHQELD